jgi:hypothetical protein
VTGVQLNALSNHRPDMKDRVGRLITASSEKGLVPNRTKMALHPIQQFLLLIMGFSQEMEGYMSHQRMIARVIVNFITYLPGVNGCNLQRSVDFNIGCEVAFENEYEPNGQGTCWVSSIALELDFDLQILRSWLRRHHPPQSRLSRLQKPNHRYHRVALSGK